MLICGLGNIGKKYEATRHNAGFFVVDQLADELNLKFDKKECQSEIARRMKDELVLQKPHTFMNLSGLAVKDATKRFKFEIDEIIVVYDDIDLPLGAVRFRDKGSAGSHNGMKSIIAELGRSDFARLRIGIGKKPHPEMDLADFVLGKFSSEEKKVLQSGIDEAVEILKAKIKG